MQAELRSTTPAFAKCSRATTPAPCPCSSGQCRSCRARAAGSVRVDPGASIRDRSAAPAGAGKLLAQTRRVLLLVEVAEAAGAFDRLPPVAVVAVPVDGRPYAVVPGSARQPAEPPDLLRVEGGGAGGSEGGVGMG